MNFDKSILVLLFYKRYPGCAPVMRHAAFGNLRIEMGGGNRRFKRAAREKARHSAQNHRIWQQGFAETETPLDHLETKLSIPTFKQDIHRLTSRNTRVGGMLIEKLGFDDVRYNPELSAFEASVQIWEKGNVYSYPVHMLAPLHAEFAVVAKGLTERALRAHRHAPARGMRLRRSPVPGELPRKAEPPILRRPGRAIAA